MDKGQCLKYLMFFFSFLITIGGLGLVAVSVWVIIDPARVVDLRPNYLLMGAASISMFAGLVLSYLGYLGCCGAAIGNTKALLLFFILVLLIFILEFAVALLLYAFGTKLHDEYFLERLKNNYTGDKTNDSYSIALNHFMVKFECCGILGPDDFLEAKLFKRNQPSDPVPKACCTRKSPEESAEILNVLSCKQKIKGYINTKSCSPAIKSLFEKYIYALTACSFAVLAAEVFALLGAWYMQDELKD